MSVEQEISALQSSVFSEIEEAKTPAALEELRVALLGKKGKISVLMRELGALSVDVRKARGASLNTLKEAIAAALSHQGMRLKERLLEERLELEKEDVTLEGRPYSSGTIHPISHVWEEVVAIFGALGFFVAEGPHIETEWYNFEALNIPKHHPARQEHDTFYFPPDAMGARKVLRTHTSPVQIRTMEQVSPPLRMLAPGRTFRCDSDQTHTPMFHQVEGLVLDQKVHLGHLKWCLETFCRTFFEVDHVKMRFRPSYFPFTEPSLEVDINCTFKDGQVRVGEGDEWLEVLGSGMVHPHVLKAAGLDPDCVQGFAFGLGLDRFAMLKYGIADLRSFFECDLRWLRHYGFSALQVPTLTGGLS